MTTDNHKARPTTGPLPAQTGLIQQTFILDNRQGLHCRPAALLVATLRDFACEATVEGSGTAANAKSIFDLMCLAAAHGTKLTFTLKGPDAKPAMAAIQALFESKFAAAYDQNDNN